MSAAGTLAGYRLEERVGVGGMAEVYRAQRLGPGGFAKQVAVKRVLPDLGRDPSFVQMFLDEARLQAQLTSPGLVQVFDFGEEGGTYYLVMEFVDGVDLGALLQAVGPLDPPLAVHVARQLCAALTDVHRAVGADGLPLGIVHRDVTPGNVLCGRDGHVKLGDFGVAKARARSVRTERGGVKGKLAYLAPEQVRGDEVDARTDLYAVGLLLFEALTGTRYLDAPGEPELWRLAGAPVFRAPGRLRAGVPTALDEVVRRALQTAPELRYPSAALLEEALAAAVPPLGPAAARRRLGALVDRAQPRARPAAGAAAGDAPGAPAPVTTPDAFAATAESTGTGLQPEPPAAAAVPDAATTAPAASRPRTEIIDDAARARGHVPAGRWRLVAGGGVVVVAAVALAVLLWPKTAAPPAPATPPGAATTGASAATAPAASVPGAPAPAPAPAAASAPAAPAPAAMDAPPATGASRKAPAPRATLAPAAPRPPPAPGASAPETSPPAAAPPAADAAALAAARERLAAVERGLAQRGVLPADAPPLFAARRALLARVAGGDLATAEIEALAARAQALTVDRAFITAKLERLNAAVAACDLPPELRQRLRRQSQEALSSTLTGRYDQANRELNAIARLLER